MKTLTLPFSIDRSGWGEGEWDSEEDGYLFWHDDRPCLILRASRGGTLNGYCGVSRESPIFGKHYNMLHGIDAPGGLTFSGRMKLANFGKAKIPRRWYIGFDCAHYGDYMPSIDGMLRVYREMGLFMPHAPGANHAAYKNVNYVRGGLIVMSRSMSKWEEIHSVKGQIHR
jgi:hypothetical protein